MKNVIKRITKHDNILLFLYVFISLSVYLYVIKFNFYDELWNFSFIYKYTNGYKLYGDLNILITPLFHMIGKAIFYIFGDNYIVFRFYNLTIYGVLCTLIYSMFKKLKVEKIYSVFYTIIILIILKGNVSAGANYNALVMIFVIVGIMLEMNKNSKLNSLLKGLNLFCMFMTKQNVFAFFCISLLILYIVQIKKISIKERMKSIILMFVSFFIPMAIFFGYLYITNSVYDFISYCFLGMNEFGFKNLRGNYYLLVYILLLATEVTISILMIKIKKINQDVKNNNLIFMPFQIMMVFYVYPIVNTYHTKFAILIPTILVIYNIHNIFVNGAAKEIFKEKHLMNFIKITIMLITIYYFSYNIYYFVKYMNTNMRRHDIMPYSNIIMDDETLSKINKVCEYIEENEKNNIDTKIISYEADAYMNVFKKNNKNLDLPFRGNLGKEGEKGLIKQVQNLPKGTKILISKEKFWQESDMLRDIITNEYTYIDEITDFLIYEK